ncbi:hypothetical protein LTR65_003957 [Meristemomyces frigidus]
MHSRSNATGAADTGTNTTALIEPSTHRPSRVENGLRTTTNDTPAIADQATSYLPAGYTITLLEASSIICINNVPWRVTDDDLVTLFSTISTVKRAEIKRQTYSRIGVAFVEFPSQRDATKCVVEFAGYVYDGRALQLSYVKGPDQPAEKKLGSDPGSVSDHVQPPQSRLMSLPQELQDLISDWAFPRQTDAIWKSLRDLDRKKRDEGRADLEKRMPKVSEFLVSKSFFVAAARSWVANQSIDCERHSAFMDVPSGVQGGIVSAFVTDLRCHSGDFWGSRWTYSLARLKVVEIAVEWTMFGPTAPTFAWEEELTAEDFNKVEAKKELTYLSGLRSFKLVASPHYRANTPAKQTMWTRNVQTFEDLLRPFVTGLRLPEAIAWAEEGSVGRLYIRSEVWLSTTMRTRHRWGVD